MLYQLNYISRETEPFRRSDIDALRDSAQVENSKNQITGFLMYRNGYFVQIIEGSLESIEGLYEKITQDKRHNIIREKIIKKIVERSFSDWALEVKIAQSDNDVRYVRNYDRHAYHLLAYFENFKLT